VGTSSLFSTPDHNINVNAKINFQISANTNTQKLCDIDPNKDTHIPNNN